MATREDLISLLASRRRRWSIRPQTLGHSDEWQQWLEAPSRGTPSRAPPRRELTAILAAKPLRPAPTVPPAPGRWRQLRMLLRQGWNDEREESRGLRIGAFTLSLLFNLLFAVMLVWLTYLRFIALATPGEEETVRIRITGFGSPDSTGGGAEAAAGDVQAAAAAAEASLPATAAATSPSQAEAADTPAPAMANAQADAPLQPPPVEQPLQVTETANAQNDFRLPPPTPVALRTPATPELQVRPVPAASEIPAPLPEVRAIAATLPPPQQPVQVLTPAPREIPTPAEPAPTVKLRELSVRTPAAGLQTRPMGSGRELPVAPTPVPAAATGGAAAVTPASGDASRASRSPAPGLPGAGGRAPTPGDQASGRGVGPAPRAAEGSWPTSKRDDDWGLADRSRAGAASGGDRGDPRGTGTQAGSGLFDRDGRPRLADDRFAPHFPDPYKQGSWLRRPTLGYRGTMFDGIWRPPETLLQEWVRKGIKTFSIPLPGGKVKLTCVISVLQAGGGCFPAPGKEGVHDQPASARPPPAVPFKPQLFENPSDLSTPKPATPAEDAKPQPAPSGTPSA